MSSLQFSYRSPAELKPYAGNARTHPKTQIAQIAASIQAGTFAQPILVDEHDVIIAGHGRLLAANQLKLTEVPVVQISGLSEGQKRVLRLADNKIAQGGGWDLDLVRIELEAIQLEGLDIEITGFSIGEFDLLVSGGQDPADDVIPPTPSRPVSQVGDIWQMGRHRIACGNVLDRDLIERLMQSEQVDAAFLDPPYNVKVQGHAGGKGKIKHREFAFASGEMTSTEFVTFLTDTLGACAKVSRPGAVHFVCMDHHHVDELSAAGGAVYGKRLNICVWIKSNPGMGSLYRSHHELVLVYRVGDAPHLNNVELGKHGRSRTNCWEYASVNTVGGSRRHDLALHPTVKPVALVADAIKDVTKPGDLILDAFLGSGTTLIAAQRSGRICRGVEIDPGYVDVAIERYRDLTGSEAVLEDSGETFGAVLSRRHKLADSREDGAGK